MRRRLLRDVLVAAVLLAGLEAYLSASLAVFDHQLAQSEAAGPMRATAENVRVMGRRDARAFLDGLRELSGRPVVVFVGDSQGLETHDGKGLPYPEEMARGWPRSKDGPVAVSLHLAGSNGYEQGLLLTALIESGVTPQVVIWAHNVASQRKNEIRAELAALYSDLAPRLAQWRPDVVVVGEAGAAATAAPGGLTALLARRWESLVGSSAIVRFARRPLYDKYQILRRSPLARLIPPAWLPGTAMQVDPPPALLRASAAFVGQVSTALTTRGARVIHVLAPIHRDVMPRPFTVRAEEVLYPALRKAAGQGKAEFLDLLDYLPADHFGTYSDGSPDAYHVDGAGHAAIAARLAGLLAGPPSAEAPAGSGEVGTGTASEGPKQGMAESGPARWPG